MKINLQNYEEYFVRFIDHDLSKEEVTEVQLFLQQHPELMTDLEAFSSTVLKPDHAFSFPAKESLKRSVHPGNYDEYFARLVEGDLSPEELKEVQVFVQIHPQMNRELDFYKSTKLVADSSVVYPDKKALKRREPGKVVPLYVRYILSASVAAGLLLIIFVKGIQWQAGSNNPSVAQIENVNPDESNATKQSNPDPSSSSNIDGFALNNDGIQQSGESVSPSSSQGPTNQKQPGVKLNKKDANKLIIKEEESVMLEANMDRLDVTAPHPLPNYRRSTKAPYLIPVYEDDGAQQATASKNSNSNSGGWLSVASLVGSEILKLTGRGDMIKSPETEEERNKTKEALSLSIQTRKFSFYHKFLNKKKSSDSK